MGVAKPDQRVTRHVKTNVGTRENPRRARRLAITHGILGLLVFLLPFIGTVSPYKWWHASPWITGILVMTPFF